METYDLEYWKERGSIEQKHLIDSLQWIQFFKPKSVFEFGAGRGERLHCFEYFGVSASGSDISQYAIDNSYGLAKGKITKEIPDTKVDLVYSYDTFEHINDDELRVILGKLKSMCKVALFGITAVDNNNYKDDETHCNPKTMDEWREFIEENGWKVEQSPKHFQYYEQILIAYPKVKYV